VNLGLGINVSSKQNEIPALIQTSVRKARSSHRNIINLFLTIDKDSPNHGKMAAAYTLQTWKLKIIINAWHLLRK
jgi:hypothetical protein